MELRRRASAFTRSIIALLVTVLALAAIGRAATPGAPQESDLTGQLGIWEGRWSYSEQDYETPYSHAHTNDGTADCNWSPNRGFMVCDFLNRDPANGAPVNDLAVFSYSPAAKAFTRVGIFKDGKPFLNQVTIEGNTWTTSAEIPYQGKTLTYRNVYVFSLEGKQRTTAAQISADKGQTWTTISQFTAVRINS
jgi:hypothetical protein